MLSYSTKTKCSIQRTALFRAIVHHQRTQEKIHLSLRKINLMKELFQSCEIKKIIERSSIKELLASPVIHEVLPVTVGSITGKY